ncbi:MAG: 3-methyl-2-oxobutanoate dehydrogenase subunit VorB [Clostridia bacterium]|nr:3-methyl-2-oxobutanoate dehydrogenase subunit VorB [Clostridia bacterium]
MAKVLIKGNEAVAEAAIRSGCRYYFGYPITPQTEIAEYMAKKMPTVGGLCLQAESEVAAINMVYGAAASGVRVMTSSSSPGISLKSEGVSYIVGCDLPCVILNVQRGGPGLGGIQPAQSDYYQATKALGHGDMHLFVLAPSSVQEMAQLTADAFGIADKYRMPVLILADGALGQMMEPVDFDALHFTPEPEKPWAANGHGNKRKKNIHTSLFLKPEELESNILERAKKYELVDVNEIRYENYLCDDADIVIVSFGITARISKAAVNEARARGIKAGLLRPITLSPFPAPELLRLADTASAFLSVELNMGQMVNDVRLAVQCRKPVEFFGRTGGSLPSSEDVLEQIIKISGGLK